MKKLNKSSKFHSPSKSPIWNKQFEKICQELSHFANKNYGCDLEVGVHKDSAMYRNYLHLDISRLPEDLHLFLEGPFGRYTEKVTEEKKQELVDYISKTLNSFLDKWQSLEQINEAHESPTPTEPSESHNDEMIQDHRSIPPVIFSSSSSQKLERASVDFSQLFDFSAFIRWEELNVSSDEDFENLSEILISVSNFESLSQEEQQLICNNLNKAHWIFTQVKSEKTVQSSPYFSQDDRDQLNQYSLDIDRIPAFKENIKDVVKLLVHL